MAQTTVRINEETREILKDLARDEGRSMSAVLEGAIRAYRRIRYLETANRGWSRVRDTPGNWITMKDEYLELEGTTGDGLPAGEIWTEEGEEVSGKTHHGKEKT